MEVETGEAGAAGPRLSPVATSSLFLAAIRLAFAAAFLAGSLQEGLEGRGALAGAALGAIVLAVLFAGPASRRRLRGSEPLPVPDDAHYDPWWLGGLRSAVPSTVGVAAMGVIALLSNRGLAAVLAGVLGAMGVLALASGIDALARERRDGARLYVERGPRPRLFVG